MIDIRTKNFKVNVFQNIFLKLQRIDQRKNNSSKYIDYSLIALNTAEI